MARGLNVGAAPPRSGGRRIGFLAVIVLVVAMHATVTSEIASALADAAAANAMPARIEVVYVRTLEPEAAKVAVAAAPAAAVPHRRPRPRAPHRVADAASAVPLVEAPPVAVAEAASEATPVDAAASAASEPVAVAAVAADAAASAASSAAAAVAVAEAPAPGASAPAADAFVWPNATRVTYILDGSYRGPINGRAEVEWIRVGERYQVNVALFAGPEFAPLFSRRMTSEGSITEGGLVPDRYDEDTQVVLRERRRVTVVFAPDSVTLANGQTRERLPGVQDTASQFIQFTWLFGSNPGLLRVGNTFEFPLALPRSMKRWTYDVADEETLYTSFGALPVFHLKPRIAVRRPNELTVDMWFSPELRYLPVRIRIEQDAANFVDLVIARKPEISAS